MPFISASVISPYNSIRGGAEGGLVPSGLLLDLYPNAAAAYSLRKLRTAYSGPAIEARKTVGGVTSVQDIGFVDNELDTASLLTFAEGGDVFVAKWYDQSGAGNDAAQVSQSSQASIVLSGVLNTTNGNVAVLGESSTVYRTGNSIFNGADGTYSAFILSKLTSNFDGIMQLNNLSSGGGGEIFRYFNTSSTTFRVQSWDSGGNAPVLVTEPINANSNAISSFIRRLDSLTTSSNSLTNSLLGLGEPRKNIEDRLVLMGSGVAGFGLESYFSEAILYPSDQTANRAGIESNINKNYNIYWDGSQTGLLDDYPNASAAYSLRALNSAYTGPAIEARRSSDDAVKDIGFLYDGSLDTDSLLSFANGGDVFVAKWYDQSGEGNDAEQASESAQPQIVSSGIVIERNITPAVQFGNGGMATANPVDLGGATELWFFMVINITDVSTTQIIYETSVNNAQNNNSIQIALGASRLSIVSKSSSNRPILSVDSPPLGTSLISFRFRGGQTNLDAGDVYINGVQQSLIVLASGTSPATFGNYNHYLGARNNSSLPFLGDIQFVDIMTSDQSANREAIESNINKNYNIYWDGSQTGLLDDYPNASAAYSLRALSSAYTGAAIKVRRSSDNAEQDINFLYDGSLDTSSLLSFVGAGDGFVTTWYDQSGAGNDVAQVSESAQPKIVSNGSLITKGGVAAIDFDGVNDDLRITTTVLNEINISHFSVSSSNSTETIGAVLCQSYTTVETIRVFNDSRSTPTPPRNLVVTAFPNTYVNAGLSVARVNTNQRLLSSFIDSSKNMAAYDNGATGGTDAYVGSVTASNGLVIGSQVGVTHLNGKVQEIILYDSNQAANRVAIETNINNHYTIY